MAEISSSSTAPGTNAERHPSGQLEATAAGPTREALWLRLEELLNLAVGQRPNAATAQPIGSRRGLASLDAEQLAELGRLYRAATTHLARAKEFGASSKRLEYLNRLVARGHAVVYGRPARRVGLRTLTAPFVLFPVTIRRTCLCHVTAALLLLFGGLYGYFGAMRDPQWALSLLPANEARTPFADRETLLSTLHAGRGGDTFEMGYGSKTAFATFLWLHNTKVALLSCFGGLVAGVPTTILLLFNGAFLGVYTATFHRHDLAYDWWAWILPHGVTELLAVVLLSGAGIYVGYTLLAPGTRTRVDALWSIRGRVLQMVLFAFPMLLLAGLIESFVRQSSLSEPARYWFAGFTAIFWIVYLGFVGRGTHVRERLDERATLAEARVSLPELDDFVV